MQVREQYPGKSFAILEAHGAIGGTWDTFRFPGRARTRTCSRCAIRSAPGRERGRSLTARRSFSTCANGARARHRPQDPLHHRVVAAAWSSTDARWNVQVERVDTGETFKMSCRSRFTCTGYYRHDEGPSFRGTERFGGEIVHPQFWTDDSDYRSKRVI